MNAIYDFSIFVFKGFLGLFYKFSPKWKKLVQGRESVFASLKKFVDGNRKEIAWFHVASLGEYEQSRPVIQEFKKVYPDWVIAVTFFSPSGFEHVVNKARPHIDFISYLPFDTPINAAQFVGTLKPKVVFFVKYDLWANFIFTIKRKNIPLFLFSASLRKDQMYFKNYGHFFRKVLRSFDHIFTQNQETVDLLKSIEYKKVSLTGDTRYDNVHATSQKPKKFPLIKSFVQERPVMVVGSAWEEDMELILPIIESFPKYKFIIAPHDVDERVIGDWQRRTLRSSVKYSEMESRGFNEEEVLFIDNMGMLSSLYQYARIAYVGGAFGKGLHNILEPLAFGIPVIFGNLQKKNKFPEAAISQSLGCGFEVKNTEELQKIVSEMEEGPTYQSARKSADELVKGNLGSAKKIIDHVQKIINPR